MKPIINKNIIIFIGLLLLNPIVFQSCETLEEEPKGILDPELYFRSEDDAMAALTAAYAFLRRETNYTKNYIIDMEVSADDCDDAEGHESIERAAKDQYTITSMDQYYWNWNYNVINRASFVVNKTPEITASEATKERIISEGRFLRCLVYFNMMRLFGDIPFYGEEYVSDPAGASEVEKTPVEDIYDFIIEDLLKAEQGLLPKNQTEKGRPTKGAAKALLAKVYMTRAGWRYDGTTGEMVQGDQKYWQMARDKAKEIIDEGNYSLCQDYRDVFAVEAENNNPESMFFINANEDENEMGNLQAGLQWLIRQKPKQKGWSSCVPEIELFLSFDTLNDKRIDPSFLLGVYAKKDGDIISKPDQEPPYSSDMEGVTFIHYSWDGWLAPRPHVNKYIPDEEYVNIDNTSRQTSHNLHVFRYAEVLLMFAEADNEVNNGPTPEAEAALDEVRTRAGLGSWRDGNLIYGKQVTYPSTYEGFRDAIRQERRYELCFEIKRRFDLVRWGILVDRIKSIPQIKQENGLEVTWLDELRAENIEIKHNLFPLPLQDVEKNPNLKQNIGY